MFCVVDRAHLFCTKHDIGYWDDQSSLVKCVSDAPFPQLKNVFFMKYRVRTQKLRYLFLLVCSMCIYTPHISSLYTTYYYFLYKDIHILSLLPNFKKMIYLLDRLPEWVTGDINCTDIIGPTPTVANLCSTNNPVNYRLSRQGLFQVWLIQVWLILYEGCLYYSCDCFR